MFGKKNKISEFDKKLDAWADKYIEDHMITQAKDELKGIFSGMLVEMMTGK